MQNSVYRSNSFSWDGVNFKEQGRREIEDKADVETTPLRSFAVKGIRERYQRAEEARLKQIVLT